MTTANNKSLRLHIEASEASRLVGKRGKMQLRGDGRRTSARGSGVTPQPTGTENEIKEWSASDG
jgi:hypothetical protein